MDYKMLFISLLTICMIGCRKDQVYTMRCLRITDYKPFSDSLYKAEGGYNVREIKFYYSLPNPSNKPIYVPLRTWFRKNVSSEIKVFFVDNTDTVIPHYSIDKVPCRCICTVVGLLSCMFPACRKVRRKHNSRCIGILLRLHQGPHGCCRGGHGVRIDCLCTSAALLEKYRFRCKCSN